LTVSSGHLTVLKTPLFFERLLIQDISLARKPQSQTAPPDVPKASVVALRLIKKYPNRRLYDTLTSSYITLHQVKEMVVAGTALQVVDAKTGEDLTRSIFLQIILEEESGGVPMFSESALVNIIRFYGHSMQGFMGSYLEKNVQAFLDIQQHMSEQSKQLTPEIWTQMMSQPNPFLKNVMGNYTEQSQQMLKQMQDQMFNAMGLKR
jgi:polyhydroxyalkanoate synthesis repressor PhaR